MLNIRMDRKGLKIFASEYGINFRWWTTTPKMRRVLIQKIKSNNIGTIEWFSGIVKRLSFRSKIIKTKAQFGVTIKLSSLKRKKELHDFMRVNGPMAGDGYRLEKLSLFECWLPNHQTMTQ